MSTSDFYYLSDRPGGKGFIATTNKYFFGSIAAHKNWLRFNCSEHISHPSRWPRLERFLLDLAVDGLLDNVSLWFRRGYISSFMARSIELVAFGEVRFVPQEWL